MRTVIIYSKPDCHLCAEAMVVLRDNTLVGFYLPVEHSFVAATEPVKLPIQQGAQP